MCTVPAFHKPPLSPSSRSVYSPSVSQTATVSNIKDCVQSQRFANRHCLQHQGLYSPSVWVNRHCLQHQGLYSLSVSQTATISIIKDCVQSQRFTNHHCLQHQGLCTVSAFHKPPLSPSSRTVYSPSVSQTATVSIIKDYVQPQRFTNCHCLHHQGLCTVPAFHKPPLSPSRTVYSPSVSQTATVSIIKDCVQSQRFTNRHCFHH
jgi:hypothetical protein